MEFYYLSDYAKAMTIKTWKSIGGCAPPNNTQARITENMTLADIASQCPYTERALARFARDHLKINAFWVCGRNYT